MTFVNNFCGVFTIETLSRCTITCHSIPLHQSHSTKLLCATPTWTSCTALHSHCTEHLRPSNLQVGWATGMWVNGNIENCIQLTTVTIHTPTFSSQSGRISLFLRLSNLEPSGVIFSYRLFKSRRKKITYQTLRWRFVLVWKQEEGWKGVLWSLMSFGIRHFATWVQCTCARIQKTSAKPAVCSHWINSLKEPSHWINSLSNPPWTDTMPVIKKRRRPGSPNEYVSLALAFFYLIVF